LDEYEWQELTVYSATVDGDIKYGSSYGLPRRSFVGGNVSSSSLCGSRSVYYIYFSASVNGNITIRGCKESSIILGLLGMKQKII